MTARGDPGAELIRALGVHFVHFAGRLIVEQRRSRNWASVTLSGARHCVSLLLEGRDAGETAAAFLSGLEAREFALDGHLLADIAGEMNDVRDDRARLILEALTVAMD